MKSTSRPYIRISILFMLVFLIVLSCSSDHEDSLNATDASVTETDGDKLGEDGGEELPTLEIEFLLNGEFEATLAQGESAHLTWSTVNVQGCEAHSSFPQWNGPVATNGELQLDIEPFAPLGEHELSLECQGAAELSAQVVRSLRIEHYCTTRPPPEGWEVGFQNHGPVWPPSPIHTFVEPADWDDLWPGPYPCGGNLQRRIRDLGENRYISIGFDIPEWASHSPYLQAVEWQPGEPDIGDGQKVITISRCPGDFHPDTQRCTQWYTSDQEGTSWQCKVEPGHRYYINILYGEVHEDNTADWLCMHDRPTCGNNFVIYGLSDCELCGGHGEYVEYGDGSGECECDPGYKQYHNNNLYCVEE